MKRTVKQLFVLAVIFSMTASLFIMPVQADSKNSYWLTGVSKAAGGNMQMYYKENAVRLKGKARKASSKSKAYDAKEKTCSYSLKISDDCKVILDEADNMQTMTYQEWSQSFGYEKGDEISFIMTVMKIRNGKIVKLYFSA